MKQKENLFDRELHIKVFSLGWWFYMIMTVFFLFVLGYFGYRMDLEGRKKLILVLSIIEYIILRLYKHSLRNIRVDYNYWNELPCYLCNQSTIMCIIGALTESDAVMSYCLTAGTIGALLAIFMPDRYNNDQRFYSKQALGFYGYHCLLIITCLSFYVLDVYQPNCIDALWVMFFIFVLAVIAHITNLIVRKTGLNPIANYAFTWGPDNAILEKMYSWIPHRLLYLLPVLGAFGAVSFLVLAILQFIG